MVTLASGMEAPLGSTTVPRSKLFPVCAGIGKATRRRAKIAKIILLFKEECMYHSFHAPVKYKFLSKKKAGPGQGYLTNREKVQWRMGHAKDAFFPFP